MYDTSHMSSRVRLEAAETDATPINAGPIKSVHGHAGIIFEVGQINERVLISEV